MEKKRKILKRRTKAEIKNCAKQKLRRMIEKFRSSESARVNDTNNEFSIEMQPSECFFCKCIIILYINVHRCTQHMSLHARARV